MLLSAHLALIASTVAAATAAAAASEPAASNELSVVSSHNHQADSPGVAYELNGIYPLPIQSDVTVGYTYVNSTHVWVLEVGNSSMIHPPIKPATTTDLSLTTQTTPRGGVVNVLKWLWNNEDINPFARQKQNALAVLGPLKQAAEHPIKGMEWICFSNSKYKACAFVDQLPCWAEAVIKILPEWISRMEKDRAFWRRISQACSVSKDGTKSSFGVLLTSNSDEEWIRSTYDDWSKGECSFKDATWP
ncbi:hypothetical protein GQ54DRAFT_331125 [Martensiomyces pterosporus]|nr:hypothetical protein GQ54DRAFT_331125 [Martensiomyces pterosporus]